MTLSWNLALAGLPCHLAGDRYGRGVMAGEGKLREECFRPQRTFSTKAEARGPCGAWENWTGGTAFLDRREYAAGPCNQSAVSAFLPSRGADPGKALLWWERCRD